MSPSEVGYNLQVSNNAIMFRWKSDFYKVYLDQGLWNGFS